MALFSVMSAFHLIMTICVCGVVCVCLQISWLFCLELCANPRHTSSHQSCLLHSEWEVSGMVLCAQQLECPACKVSAVLECLVIKLTGP